MRKPRFYSMLLVMLIKPIKMVGVENSKYVIKVDVTTRV